MEKKFRILTIHSKYQKRVYKDAIIPEIRLEGKWLKELGFVQGMKVQVEQRSKKLIIRLVKEEKR